MIETQLYARLYFSCFVFSWRFLDYDAGLGLAGTDYIKCHMSCIFDPRILPYAPSQSLSKKDYALGIFRQAMMNAGEYEKLRRFFMKRPNIMISNDKVEQISLSTSRFSFSIHVYLDYKARPELLDIIVGQAVGQL